MKTSSKTEKTKAWRVEKAGNTTVAIYRRDKFHKASGKTYQVYEVADYSTGKRRMQSKSNPAEAIAEAQRLGRLLASGETSAAKLGGNEAASYGRAVELLRAGGLDTPLELVAARYADAVKILGADLIVEAAKFYAQRNPATHPALSASRCRGKVGSPFEKEERYHKLVTRQSEIEEQLDLTKNQAPSQIETPDNGENDVEIGLPKIVEKTEKPARRVRVKV